MIINIAIPSLDKIQDMDREDVKVHLHSAIQQLEKLARYIKALDKRLTKG